MLVRTCDNCGKFFMGGYENEYHQTFCCERCYKKFCKKNGYESRPDKLTKVTNIIE